MPRKRPTISGYARLAQAEEEDEEYPDHPEEDDPFYAQRTISHSTAPTSPVQPSRHAPMQQPQRASAEGNASRKRTRVPRRLRSNSIDIKTINARLEKWADEIASKFKLRKVKGKSPREERLDIHHSVFQAPEDIRPASMQMLAASFAEHPERRLTKMQFDDVVESVKVAIELGVHPKMISKGSSGSYFGRNSEGRVVGIFKPKDEEPYATRNPKWTKWIHRNLFPFFFGRACLIPNLSYISEAAAYVLDTRLQTNIVPYTDIVYLSSISFNYDFWDRRAFYRKKKPLNQKVGSFQVFLNGFKDATEFLREHPWPDQQTSTLQTAPTTKTKRTWTEDCNPGRGAHADYNGGADHPPAGDEARRRKVFWTDKLQQSFREELEKLVILDYIMRNTDRGLDNWMIRIDEDAQEVRIVADPSVTEDRASEELKDVDAGEQDQLLSEAGPTGLIQPSEKAELLLGAIDNSLSWPWKHPDAWRSFPFGWLFLPVSLIGQPFTTKTRQHFLPLLTSKQWWSETQVALRQCFSQDSDFKERMFARQIAVMKGQAWNVVETLKTPEHGPLELTRRSRVYVWDDLVEIPVVVPLRVPTDDMRRKQEIASAAENDSTDISTAAQGSAPQQNSGLLAPATPDSAMNRPNRFNISRHGSLENIRAHSNDSRAKVDLSPDGRGKKITLKLHDAKHLEPDRPELARSKTNRASYDANRPRWFGADGRKRHLSFSERPSTEDDSDLEGDLGFAAARDLEETKKKVIVERLEMVKGKNPVFTWC